jgi:hypothetical protein
LGDSDGIAGPDVADLVQVVEKAAGVDVDLKVGHLTH